MVSKTVKIISGVLLAGAVAGVVYTKGCNKPTIHVSIDRNNPPKDFADALGSDAYSSATDATSTVLAMDATSTDTHTADLESRVLPQDTTACIPEDVTSTLPATVTPTVTPTDCSNHWYNQIKAITSNTVLTPAKKTDALGNILTAYITKQGGEIIIPVQQYTSKTNDPKKVCQGGLNVLYTMIVSSEKAADVDVTTQRSFTKLLTPYICETKTISADDKYPYLRFKLTK